MKVACKEAGVWLESAIMSRKLKIISVGSRGVAGLFLGTELYAIFKSNFFVLNVCYVFEELP